jgi:hypothetical protein
MYVSCLRLILSSNAGQNQPEAKDIYRNGCHASMTPITVDIFTITHIRE